jgi:hypothetical protein
MITLRQKMTKDDVQRARANLRPEWRREVVRLEAHQPPHQRQHLVAAVRLEEEAPDPLLGHADEAPRRVHAARRRLRGHGIQVRRPDVDRLLGGALLHRHHREAVRFLARRAAGGPQLHLPALRQPGLEHRGKHLLLERLELPRVAEEFRLADGDERHECAQLGLAGQLLEPSHVVGRVGQAQCRHARLQREPEPVVAVGCDLQARALEQQRGQRLQRRALDVEGFTTHGTHLTSCGAICASGSTFSTPQAAIASLGMPNTTPA